MFSEYLGESVDGEVTNDKTPYRAARLTETHSDLFSFASQEELSHWAFSKGLNSSTFSCSVVPTFPGLASGARAEGTDIMEEKIGRRNLESQSLARGQRPSL